MIDLLYRDEAYTLICIVVSGMKSSEMYWQIKYTVRQKGTRILSYNKEHFRQILTLREESSQTNVILQYKLLAAILIAVCSVIQQS